MTNTIALFIGLAIVAAIGLDQVLNEGTALVFMTHKFLDLLEWVTFWR